jgi:hypothetical protein
MRRRGLLALAAAAACACAGVPTGPRTPFTFPPDFDASQVVVVETGDGERELIASLRRRDGDYEVALLDPIFGAPVLDAAIVNGAVHVRDATPGASAHAERLLRVLAEVYTLRYARADGGRTSSQGPTLDVALHGITQREGCKFPARISVRPRRGSGPAVEVRTLDVTCRTSTTTWSSGEATR